MNLSKNTSGFTLVEMILATTIFAVMSVMVISIYLQTTAMSSRLKATRYLSESAREITERIAEDVKEKGIGQKDFSYYPYWDATEGYTQSGKEILGIGDGTIYYLYGQKSINTIIPCQGDIKTKPNEHCGLYKVVGIDYDGAFNLVDSFIPDEKKKRVKIDDLKFYISGDGISTEKKVTLVFTLALMPRIGVPNMDVSESKIHIQTTISERFFK